MGLNVLVVGAGPAGLCTALALKQDGHSVTVVERRHGSGLNPSGGILMIQHAACRAISHVEGMSDALASVDVGDDWASWWSYRGVDEPIATKTTQKGPVERWQVDRSSVQKVLLELALEKGIRILSGKEVVRILDNGTKATLWTNDDMELSADLVVGADGIKSTVRRLLFPGEDVEPVPLREVAHYAIVPLDRLEKLPILRPWLNNATFYMVWGPERFCVFRQVYGGKLGMLLFDTNYGDPLPVDGQWNTPGDITELRKRFADFSPLLQAYLDEVHDVEKWQIAHLSPLKTWLSSSGRIALVGDAAHAMVPHVAQGLSQGFEDGITLARMLRGWTDLSVSVLTREWMRLRKPRAERFQEAALVRTALASLPDGPEQEARDARLREQGESAPETNWEEIEADISAPSTTKPYTKWATMHDVVAEADNFLSELRSANSKAA